MTILATWVTLQDRMEQVIVKEKGKLLEAWIWSQIQTRLSPFIRVAVSGLSNTSYYYISLFLTTKA